MPKIKPLQERNEEAEARYRDLTRLLKGNASPVKVAEVLVVHYRELAQECLIGSVNIPARDYWLRAAEMFADTAEQLADAESD